MSLDSFPNIPRRADGAIDTDAYAAIAAAERRGAMWQADAALRGRLGRLRPRARPPGQRAQPTQ